MRCILRNTVIASVVMFLLVGVLGAFMLIDAPVTPQTPSGNLVVQSRSEEPAAGAIPGAEERPDCVGDGVGGIDLPCLGGDNVPGEHADVTIVNVWAWWCTPCQEELPVMQQFADRHPEYDVVGVHADANAANGIAMLNDLGVTFPSYQDEVGKFAGLLGLPNVVPINMVYKQGQPVGMFPQAYYSVEDLEAAIGSVL